MDSKNNYWTRKSRLKRRSFLKGSALAAGAFIVPAVLVGCGDDDDVEPTPTQTGDGDPTATSAPDATATATSAPQPTPTEPAGGPIAGGVFHTIYSRDAPTLNIVKESTFATHQPMGLVYNRLLQYKAGQGIAFSSTEVEGDLAEDWSISDDGLAYTFKLREGVKWQEVDPVNGRDFTSEDVKFAVEFLADPENLSPSRSLYDGVTSVDTPDDSTVVFNLASPRAEFLENIANHYALMFPRELAEGAGFDAAAAGTGPYIFEKWEPGVGIDLVKNPNYFKEDLPYIDRVEWRVVTDGSARTAALRGGRIDVGPYCCGPALRDLDTLEAELGDEFDFVEGVRSNGYFLTVQGGPDGVLDLPMVKKAISRVLPRKAILNNLYSGKGVFQGHVPFAMDRYTLPSAELESLFGEPDVADAKALMSAAGVDGEIEIDMMGADNSTASALSQLVQATLAEIDIKGTITPVDRATYFAKLESGDFELANLLGSTSWSLDFWLSQFYKTGAGRNYFGYSSAAYDALADKISAEFDIEARRDLAHEAQRMLADDLPTIPVGQGPQSMPISKKLVGYGEHWSYGFPALERAWFSA